MGLLDTGSFADVGENYMYTLVEEVVVMIEKKRLIVRFHRILCDRSAHNRDGIMYSHHCQLSSGESLYIHVAFLI